MTEHRDDLVRTRTQTINRLHALLVKLIAPGLPRGLSTETTVMALPRIRPTTTVVRTLRHVSTSASVRADVPSLGRV